MTNNFIMRLLVGLGNENQKPRSNFLRFLIKNGSEKSECTTVYRIGHFKIKRMPKIKSDRSIL